MISKQPIKPYLSIPIADCGEPLIPIPPELFVLENPPPYLQLGADYGDENPYCLREGVLSALLEARNHLNLAIVGWKLKIFDAYRPVDVQQYMVDYTFREIIEQRGISTEDSEDIWQEVYKIWAVPSNNPKTPPPHSTGAAVDLTLVDSHNEEIDMGGQIDELSDRSEPDYYRDRPDQQEYQIRREILLDIMTKAGFRRHPGEWWHFSLGDQMWTWQYNLEIPSQTSIARYGRVRI